MSSVSTCDFSMPHYQSAGKNLFCKSISWYYENQERYGVYNQSVEKACVAFVKGANERNEFFGKNKQTVIYDEQVWTNKAKD